MRFPRSNRRTWLLAGVLVVVAVVVAVYAIHELGKPSNHVQHQRPPSSADDRRPPRRRRAKVNNFTWPFYGGQQTRTRDFTGDPDLNPPLKLAWRFGGNALLEFPPSIYGNNLYYLDDGATAKKVNMSLQRQQEAASGLTHVGPALCLDPGARSQAAGDVRHGALDGEQPQSTAVDGELAALSMKTGKILWTSLPAARGTESSPMVVGNSVYFGDQAGGNSAGTMYSLNITTHKSNWSRSVAARSRPAPAYYDGDLYFGNYGGSFYAVNAKTGQAGLVSSPQAASSTRRPRSPSGASTSATTTAPPTRSSRATEPSPGAARSATTCTPARRSPIRRASVRRSTSAPTAASQAASLRSTHRRARRMDPSTPATPVSGSATVINNTVYFSTVYKPN